MGDTLREDIHNALDQFISIGFGLIEAVIVLLGAAVVVRALRRRVNRRLAATLAPENAKQLAENAVTLGVFGAAVTLLLTLWGVTWSTLLTAVGLSTLVVALGLQGVLQSLVAGVFILFERPFNVGDRVKYSGHDVEGTVEEIALRTTVIRTEDGTRVVTPNSFIFSQAVHNFSPDRAILSIVTVHGAGEPGRTARDTRELVEAALTDVPGLTTRPEVTVRSRLRKPRVPRPIARFRRLGQEAEQLAQTAFDQATQVRVSWSGTDDQAVREEVLKRLRELFPDSRVSLRRW
jgi:small-conductance mechanosensitive channel